MKKNSMKSIKWILMFTIVLIFAAYISEAVGETVLAKPLNSLKVNSGFVPNRHVYSNGKLISDNAHLATDYAGKTGDTVMAIADGTVNNVFWDDSSGNNLIIEHVINGVKAWTRCCHLSKVTVSKGDKVSAGQKVAEVGNTGTATTGAHLHFQIATGKKPSKWGYKSSTFSNYTAEAEVNGPLAVDGTTFWNPHRVLTGKDIIGNPNPASSFSFENVAYPKTFKINTSVGWDLSGGTLVCNKQLKTITTVITTADGKTNVSGPKSYNISGYSYPIINLDTKDGSNNGVRFSFIKNPGDYKWILTATDEAGRELKLEMPFTAVSSGSTATEKISITWPNAIYVASITLSSPGDMYPNETTDLTATIAPENATNKAINWTSSDNSIVMVDADGKLTAIKQGSATVTATAADGSKISASITVQVKSPDELSLYNRIKRAMLFGWPYDSALDLNNDGTINSLDYILAKKAELGIKIDETNFPDQIFREAVGVFDTDKNGYLNKDELAAAKEINCPGISISNLKGIEHFTDLKVLHQEVTDAAVAATCTEAGLTEGKHCSRCGEVLVAQIAVAALGHNEVADAAVAATCTEDGLTEGSHCSVCNTVIKKQEKVAALGHKEVIDKAVAATYTTTGLTEGKHCERCGEVLVKQQEIAKLVPQTPEEKIEAFVTRCYKLILNRDPDSDGLQSWCKTLKEKTATAAQIIDGFVRSGEYIDRKVSAGDSVDILYRTMLDREADEGGKAGWVSALNQGYTLQNIIDGFCESAEFTGLCKDFGIEPGKVGAATPAAANTPRGKIEAFVRRCYKLILSREADEGGLKGWSDALEQRVAPAAKIIDGFVQSPEYVNRKLSDGESVDILYKTMLDREADESGRAGWVAALGQGFTLQHIINGFCGSVEFTGICNDYGITPGKLAVSGAMVKFEAITPEGDEAEAPVVYQGYNSEFINEEKIRAFVEHCYVSVFGREGDAEGVENYTALILDGKKTPKSVAKEFVFSAEFQSQLPGNEEFIRILYRLYFDREPGAEELSGWVTMLENGVSLEEIVDGFAGSDEFKVIFNEMKN